MNNLFILDLDKLLIEARSNPDEKRTVEQIVYTWLLKHIAKSLINRDVSVNELPMGTHSEKASWVMKWLHLSDYEIEGMLTTLFMSISEGIHGAELCDEFRTHWTHNTGIIANVSYDNQEVDIVEAVNKHAPDHEEHGISFDGMSNFFESLFRHIGPKTNVIDMPAIETWEEAPLKQAIKSEIKYIKTSNISIDKGVRAKLIKHLKAGKINKYAKLMDSIGLKIRNFQEVVDSYVPIRPKSQPQGIGADLDGDVIPSNFDNMVGSPGLDKMVSDFAKELSSRPGMLRKRGVSYSGPSNEWTELLTYNPSTNDPVQRSMEIDRYYIEHGVVLEEPMSFDKATAFYSYQLVTEQIDQYTMVDKLNKVLKCVLGEELFAKVELRFHEEHLMLGFKSREDVHPLTKMLIAKKLRETRILN